MPSVSSSKETSTSPLMLDCISSLSNPLPSETYLVHLNCSSPFFNSSSICVVNPLRPEDQGRSRTTIKRPRSGIAKEVWTYALERGHTRRGARDAIGDSDFFLIPRTDARALSAKTGLSEAIVRANLYMESGADASFVEAPRDDDELKEIRKRTKGYRLCNMLESELKDPPLTSVYASIRPLVDLREKGTTKDHYEKMITIKEFNRLVNLGEWYELETKLLQSQKRSWHN
ncbi:hypothetical protein F2Q69_00027261 [Brassica cretica]|uniref:Uncharacterized protein n=1 Tax=Brassica cretica TaxID=69181 RepID=A0A8S9RS76_BRACR|nr:hypothetical protein F2Q69_00027261 [Brassica cretica]